MACSGFTKQKELMVKTDKRMVQNMINTLLNGNMEMWEHRGDAPVTLKQRNEGKLPIIINVSAKILRMHRN